MGSGESKISDEFVKCIPSTLLRLAQLKGYAGLALQLYLHIPVIRQRFAGDDFWSDLPELLREYAKLEEEIAKNPKLAWWHNPVTVHETKILLDRQITELQVGDAAVSYPFVNGNGFQLIEKWVSLNSDLIVRGKSDTERTVYAVLFRTIIVEEKDGVETKKAVLKKAYFLRRGDMYILLDIKRNDSRYPSFPKEAPGPWVEAVGYTPKYELPQEMYKSIREYLPNGLGSRRNFSTTVDHKGRLVKITLFLDESFDIKEEVNYVDAGYEFIE